MAAIPDYRVSHAERGATYDATLASTPFDAYMASWERQHLTRLVPDLYPGKQALHLDFACGTGRVAATVAPLCRSTVGVDVSASMIEVARRKLPDAEFHLCDLTSTALDIGTFDLVTAFRFFGNAQPELRDSALRAIAERLRPGGHLVINSHRNPRALYALFDRLAGGPPHGMDLHPGRLASLLSRHGLAIRRTIPIGAWMYRSRLLLTTRADDRAAIRNEALFGHPRWASIAPDAMMVAQRVS
jgi:ubiquinone/menaquinone biosynthesis C-methylase UbiE